VGGATSAPSAAFNCQSRPSQATAYTVYLPGPALPITGTASWPPGQSVPPLRPLPSGAHVFAKCFLQSWAPVAASTANMSSDTPATMRTSFFPRGFDSCCNQRRKQVMHLSRDAVQSGLPEKFHFADIVHGEGFVGLEPPGAPLSPPSIRYSASTRRIRSELRKIVSASFDPYFILWSKRPDPAFEQSHYHMFVC